MRNLFKILCTFMLILMLLPSIFGQNSKKESINRYHKAINLSIDKIKTQAYSNLARELLLENFMTYYIENGKQQISKKYGHETIDSVYQDSTYTYFLRHAQGYSIDFVKLLACEIADINLESIDGN